MIKLQRQRVINMTAIVQINRNLMIKSITRIFLKITLFIMKATQFKPMKMNNQSNIKLKFNIREFTKAFKGIIRWTTFLEALEEEFSPTPYWLPFVSITQLSPH